MNFAKRFRTNTQVQLIENSFRILEKKDQKRILIVMLLQVLLGFLDLLGVIVIGVVGALAVNGIQSQPAGNRVTTVLKLLSLDGMNFQNQVAILGAVAALVLMGRTLMSMYITRRILYYLSRRSSIISSDLISKLLSQNLLTILEKSTQETLYALTSGVNTLMLGVIGTVIAVSSDLFLLILLSGGLFMIDPAIAISTFMIFSLVATGLYFAVHNRVNVLGNESARLTIRSNEKILEVLNSYRELYVRHRRAFYIEDISQTRMSLAVTSAELAFIPNIGKYIIEITLVFGAITICSIQFAINDATHAISILSVFLVAGSRIAPAILRIQSGAIALKSSAGPVSGTLSLINRIGDSETLSDSEVPLDTEHIGFVGNVEIMDVSFSYPGTSKDAVSKISLEIPSGSIVAFVGPSGAGKTTLIDLILGLLEPKKGAIKISGTEPAEAIKKWPGAISYVPQDVLIVNGSILENIALGFPKNEQFEQLAIEALRISQLEKYVDSKEMYLDSEVGERGSKMSGGQRQRLGIARAMYTKPKLLVLDEATSALDGQTESDFSDAIAELRNNVTVLMIAHRLSTVRGADVIVYIDEGRVISYGNFEKVRKEIPDFAVQASKMGL
jgi:ABC-type multidrug transport system fused ATPase/permease subunit